MAWAIVMDWYRYVIGAIAWHTIDRASTSTWKRLHGAIKYLEQPPVHVYT